MFAPGSSIVDAAGQFPSFPGRDVPLEQAFAGEPMPSIKENIAAGGIDKYLFAPLQGLGALGDAAYGIPGVGAGIGAALKTPVVVASILSGIGKSGKSSKSLKTLKEKGFDVDNPLYHGTHETFKTFDPSKIGKRDKGFYGKGFYFTNMKKEAEMYGPNVGEYYIKGNILNLGDFSEINRVLSKSSDFDPLAEPLQDYKLWAKKLNAIDALPPAQKKAYNDFVKADKYFEKNYELIPTKKIETGPAKGQTVYQGKIKDPYYENDIVLDNIDDKNDLKEIFYLEIEGNHPSFPNFGDIKRNVSDLTRDADRLEYNEGIEDVSQYIADKVKASGYTGIKSGSETVVFNPKNIIQKEKKSLAKGGPTVIDGLPIINPVADVGSITPISPFEMDEAFGGPLYQMLNPTAQQFVDKMGMRGGGLGGLAAEIIGPGGKIKLSAKAKKLVDKLLAERKRELKLTKNYDPDERLAAENRVKQIEKQIDKIVADDQS